MKKINKKNNDMKKSTMNFLRNGNLITLITFLLLLAIISITELSWAQTQPVQGQVTQGPVYNFQFFNSPVPTTTAGAAAATTTIPLPTNNNTNQQPPVATIEQPQQQQTNDIIKGNKWIPSLFYFTTGVFKNSFGIGNSSNTETGSTRGYGVSFKIPLGTSFSVVPKYMLGKTASISDFDSYRAFGVDFRYDYHSGKYLSTGFGLSTLTFSKKERRSYEEVIDRYYYSDSWPPPYQHYYAYSIYGTENYTSQGLGAGLFLAPNFTVGFLNMEVAGHLGYQIQKDTESDTGRLNPRKGQLYTTLMLNLGIAI
ncbi:MAG: hypothetical protein HQK51_01765 [Oligoflexia bacterium]|nr:hypothetical protein [Oligoflexia bacterium]